MTRNQVFENCQLEKSHCKINHIVTTECIILAQNQHSIFIFHYFNAKLLAKYSQIDLILHRSLQLPRQNTKAEYESECEPTKPHTMP